MELRIFLAIVKTSCCCDDQMLTINNQNCVASVNEIYEFNKKIVRATYKNLYKSSMAIYKKYPLQYPSSASVTLSLCRFAVTIETMRFARKNFKE